jgi:hypothetical protein
VTTVEATAEERITTTPSFPRRLRIRLAGEVLVSYAVVRWLLPRKGLPEVVAALRATEPAIDLARFDPFIVSVRLGKATRRTLDMLPTDSRCLMRSLVLLRMLRRRGIDTVLVIGVAVDDGFDAHAWLEHDDRPVLPTDPDHYGRLLVA